MAACGHHVEDANSEEKSWKTLAFPSQGQGEEAVKETKTAWLDKEEEIKRPPLRNPGKAFLSPLCLL